MLSRCQSLTFEYFHREGEEGGSLFLQTRWPYGINKRQFSKVCLLNIEYNMPLWSLCTAEKCDPATELMSTGNAAQTRGQVCSGYWFFPYFYPDGLGGRPAPGLGALQPPQNPHAPAHLPKPGTRGLIPKDLLGFGVKARSLGTQGRNDGFFLVTAPNFSVWGVMMLFGV